MKKYFRDKLWDMLLCFAMSLGMAVNILAGYDSPDPKVTAVWAVAAVAAVCTLLLFLAGSGRGATIAGIVIGVAALFGAIVYVRSTGVLGGAATFDESPALFWIVTVLTSLVCYLLSRSRAGVIILAAAGFVVTAVFRFLEYPVSLWAFLLFAIGALTAWLYRVYAVSLLRADSGSVRTKAYIAQSVALVALTLAVAGGVYLGVVRPLDPPTRELKLISTLKSLDVMEKIGVSKKTELPAPDNMTQQTDDRLQTVQAPPELTPPPTPTPEPEESEQLIQTITSPAQAIAYEQHRSPLGIVLLCLLGLCILALPFVLKHFLTRRWEARLRTLSPSEQAKQLYEYFFRKLRYAGYSRPHGVTVQEYVDGNAAALADFAVDGSDLPALTRSYQSVVYGGRSLTESEAEPFWRVYGGFRRALGKKLGLWRRAIRYFSI